MKDFTVKVFTYKCGCGFTMNVYVDYGVPQETIKCKKCENSIKRSQS
jgi:hypothetical protein